MYLPAHFREERPDVLRTLIQRHPLGTIITFGASGLSANLVPFTLAEAADPAAPMVLRCHVARANPQIADLSAGAECLVLFQGPEAYISPAWYATKAATGRVVPTWNYAMVQARGVPRLIDDPVWIMAQIEALTGEHESPRPEPWAVADAPSSFVEGMLRAIVGVEIAVTRCEGKWKTSQNRPVEDRRGVVAGLERERPEREAMANLVRRTLPTEG
ncbi:MAG: FMN-binding negative transcriptional regulator [Chloroflexi bacterium]|nr:FMN-binding negative transcriptional regulator [Chloroflexota bacterium]